MRSNYFITSRNISLWKSEHNEAQFWTVVRSILCPVLIALKADASVPKEKSWLRVGRLKATVKYQESLNVNQVLAIS
jgi:hypothetical protein